MPLVQVPNNWRPRAYQSGLWNYLERGGKHAEVVWHRRSGKDEVALHRTAVAAFERIACYWYMLPEYKQARKAIWDAINPHTGKKRIDEVFPHEIRKATRGQEMMIEFINGSSFQVVGSDDPNSLVGAPPAGIVYSEWALSNPATRAYLRPILAENNGWQIFNTTSRGRNHAYRTLQAAQADPNAFAQILTAHQTDVFTAEQLEAERLAYIADFGEDYGIAKFEQEYLCSFDAANIGSILARSIGKLEQIGMIGTHVGFDPDGAPIEISADIGRRDTATWWFWQPKIGGYSIVDYDGGWGLDADQWCDRLQAKLEGYKLGMIWLPHDARAKTFAAKNSALEIFVKRFGPKYVSITPDSSISDRVNAARVMIGRCEFSDKCEKGLDGLRAWSYEYNDENKSFSQVPKHDWACFHPNTIVLTRYGTRQIIDLPENGEVLTLCGWKAYLGPKKTRVNAQLVEVVFKNGYTVLCTPEHKFLTENGWISAQILTKGSLIQSSLTPSFSILMAAYIACGRANHILQEVGKNYIEWFGNQLLVKYLKNAISTIRTVIQQITPFQTWSACQVQSMQNIQSEIHRQKKDSQLQPEKRQQNGIDRKQGCFGINGKQKELKSGQNGAGWISHALNVEKTLRHLIGLALPLKNFAPKCVGLLTIESVLPVNEKSDVWCINVPDVGQFSLANGAIVSNSHDGDGFSYGCLIMQQTKPPIEKKPRTPVGPLTVDQFIRQSELKHKRSGRI